MEEKKPSKNRAVKKKNLTKEHKGKLAKKMKIEMIRYCLVWNYNDKQTIAYFKERGVVLSIPYYYELKADFLSDEATKGWYTEQAISAMEVTHKQSVEQLDELIKVTMIEIQQLQSTTVYVQKRDKVPDKDGVPQPDKILQTLNQEHDSLALAKMMDTLTKLTATRDDMLAATPVVQAIMNKHAEEKAKSMITR